MGAQFEQTIGELWTALDLPMPKFAEAPSIILTVDQTDLTIKESQDGLHLNLYSTAGRLSRDPLVRTMQIRQLLVANLATMTSLGACVSLDDTTPPDTDVTVCAVYPYATRRIGVLIAAAQDVLALSQSHAVKLKGNIPRQATHRSSQAERAMALQEDHSLIFRP